MLLDSALQLPLKSQCEEKVNERALWDRMNSQERSERASKRVSAAECASEASSAEQANE